MGEQKVGEVYVIPREVVQEMHKDTMRRCGPFLDELEEWRRRSLESDVRI